MTLLHHTQTPPNFKDDQGIAYGLVIGGLFTKSRRMNW